MPRCFLDPKQFGWTQILESHYEPIKKEWQQSPKELRQARTYYHHGQKLEKENSKWDLIVLMNKSTPVIEMFDFFPETMSLMHKLPIHENLSFSIFYPGAETVPHRGWSEDIVRVHLAIDTNPDAVLCCGGQSVSLNNGEVLIFEDGQEHYAYNRSAKERTVLLFDVLKINLHSNLPSGNETLRYI